MQIHNVQQGSPEWLALRRQYFTASEAPSMMGVSPYITRNELLRQKATGLTPEVDERQQSRFDAGHMAEASYRPIAEEQIGEELYPVTGTAHIHGLQLLASFDGLTMDERIGFEHKLLNQNIVEHLVAHGEPGPAYYWQLEHQLLVSGAEKILFATSNGTADGAVAYWYKSKPERRAALIAGWRQFADDLAEWKQPEVVTAPIAAPIESLPAVSVQMQGQLVVASNLPDFSVALRAFINRMVPKPSTDQEFADAEAECKALKKAEDALAAAEEQSLASLSDVAEARRVMADLKNLARTTRLAREKLVAAEKDARRTAIYQGGLTRWQAHIASLNARLGRPYMPVIPGVDFAAAIKGKRSLESMQDAVDTHLSTLKIAANEVADRIQLNLDHLRAEAADYTFLFADTAQIVLKAPEDLQALVANRINAHKQAEAERLEKERAAIAEQERVRAEEKVRAEQEAAAKAELDRRNAEAKALETVAPPAQAQPMAEEPAPVPAQTFTPPAPYAVECTEPVPAASPPTMTNGKVCQILGFNVTADFLVSIGAPAPTKQGNANLWHERQIVNICEALGQHLQAVHTAQKAKYQPARSRTPA